MFKIRRMEFGNETFMTALASLGYSKMAMSARHPVTLSALRFPPCVFVIFMDLTSWNDLIPELESMRTISMAVQREIKNGETSHRGRLPPHQNRAEFAFASLRDIALIFRQKGKTLGKEELAALFHLRPAVSNEVLTIFVNGGYPGASTAPEMYVKAVPAGLYIGKGATRVREANNATDNHSFIALRQRIPSSMTQPLLHKCMICVQK